MKINPAFLELYVITDRALAKGRSILEVVAAVLAGGVKVIQLREKNITTREMVDLAGRIKVMTVAAGAKLIINDRVDVALAVQADGVHLGDEDMPCQIARRILGRKAIIGKSVDTMADASKAAAEGADYLGAGAVFTTATKEEAPAIGTTGLAQVCSCVDLPVVAIGGINRENAAQAIAAGAAGVAVVSAVLGADDLKTACRELHEQILLGKAMRRGASDEQNFANR
jgi:thiamine-phosphate pyrophosphorylase